MPPDQFQRKTIRIPGYDYTNPGYYFITISSLNNTSIFGTLTSSNFEVSKIGEIVMKCWSEITYHFENARLDEWKLMPNHLHGIIELKTTAKNAESLVEGTNSNPASTGTIYRARTNYETFGKPIAGSIPTIIRTFKAAVTRDVGFPVWHRGYYEHIVRNSEDLQRVREYIDDQYNHWRKYEDINAQSLNDAWQLVETKSYGSETELQDLLADEPSLISISEVNGVSGPLIVAIKEFPVSIGSIDILGFTEDGNIAVVECKLAKNAEIKRQVIAQVLEYGAGLWGLDYKYSMPRLPPSHTILSLI